ncbi:MAG: prolyl oligopeptidase family serine peptidase [Anditalea sp.]
MKHLLSNKIKKSAFTRRIWSVILTLVLVNPLVQAQDDLNVLQDNWVHFSDAPHSLYKHLAYPGAQAFISGKSQAMYMIWDGIRAVDYLLTREEVDPERIGITGRSGGGTQSSYIAAIDERIDAAAPENYITNFTRLLETNGPQDAEQNFLHGIAQGLDQPDLLIVRAPKPTLMITTTRDIFSIQGARETAKEVSGIYEAYGEEQNFSMVEDDAGHASTPKNREAMYAFFQHHLDNPGAPKDEEVELLSDEDIQVTSTGQISTSLEGERVFSLNREDTEKLISQWSDSRTEPTTDFSRVVEAAKKLSGYVEIEWFVKSGFTVLAPDMIGIGEVGAGEFKGDSNFEGNSYNYQEWIK